jgi:hypothetical protein
MITKNEDTLKYRWQSNVAEFNMPIDVYVNGKKLRIYPTKDWQTIESGNDFSVAEDSFFINTVIL